MIASISCPRHSALNCNKLNISNINFGNFLVVSVETMCMIRATIRRVSQTMQYFSLCVCRQVPLPRFDIVYNFRIMATRMNLMQWHTWCLLSWQFFPEYAPIGATIIGCFGYGCLWGILMEFFYLSTCLLFFMVSGIHCPPPNQRRHDDGTCIPICIYRWFGLSWLKTRVLHPMKWSTINEFMLMVYSIKENALPWNVFPRGRHSQI